MILNRILPTILVSCVLSLTAYSQKQEKSDAYLDASESTIYLSFERFGGNDSVWLRLHNNSLWAISIRTEDFYSGSNVTPLTLWDGREVNGVINNLEIVPSYFVENAADGVETSYVYWCTASTSWLPSGRSVLFGFPRKLNEWEQISLRYAYEWESEGYTAQHRVRFQGKDLPTIR